MWPHKKGLGVQLTYGVKGNGTIIPTQDDTQNHLNSIGNLQFPVLDEPHLNRISKQPKKLVPKQTSNGIDTGSNQGFSTGKDGTGIMTVRNTRKAKPKNDMVQGTSLSNNLVKSFESNSQVLDNMSAYDPTFGNTIEFFESRATDNRSTGRSTVAYATGNSGSILTISPIVPQKQQNDGRGNNDNHDDTESEISIPRFLKGVNIDLKEPIRQINAFNPPQDHLKDLSYSSVTGDYLLVRTQLRIYLLNCTRSTNTKIPFNISLVDDLKITDLGNEAFADFCWSPYVNTEFMVIDIKANVFKISISQKSKFQINKVQLNDNQPTLDSYLELSNWHRILWVKPFQVVVASRSCLMTIDLKSHTSEKILTANTWSQIQDLSVMTNHTDNNTQYMFLLTSRELIWLDISDKFTRLLSWKHFLAENDPSLKFVVHREEEQGDDKFVCLIYSQLTPLVICLNFGIKHGRPFSLSSPSVIYLEENRTPIQSLKLIPLHKILYKSGKTTTRSKSNQMNRFIYGLFDLRINLEINVNILGYKPSTSETNKDPQYTDMDFSKLKKMLKKHSLRPYNSLYFERLGKNNLLPLVKSIIKSEPDNFDQVYRVQQFAYQLGEGGDLLKTLMEKRNSGEEITDPFYASLLDLTADIPTGIGDFTEFDTMLDQLKAYYHEIGLEVIDLAPYILSHLKFFKADPNVPISSQDVFNLLEENYLQKGMDSFNRKTSSKQLIILLLSCMMKLRSPDTLDYYENLEQETLRKASPNTKMIIDEWDNDHEETSPIVDFNTQIDREPMISSMPTIKIASQERSSQERSQRFIKSKQRKHDMRRTALLSSQLPDSQISPTKSKSKSKSKTKTKNKSKSSSNSSQILPTSSQSSASQSSQSTQPASQPSGPSASTNFSAKRPYSSQSGASQKSKKKRKSGFA